MITWRAVTVGLGKRTAVEEYRRTRRGSQGVKTTDTKRGATVVGPTSSY